MPHITNITANDATNNIKTKTSARRKKKITAHRAAYLVHSFVGLKLSLIFSIVLITGTIAVFAEEIDWLTYSEIRVTPEGSKLNEGELFDRLQTAMPDSGFAGMVTSSDRTRTAAYAFVTQADGSSKKVWINPYSGKINGTTDNLTIGSFFSALHYSLFMPLIGRALVNGFGVLCLIGLISGLISYRRFWREFFTLPRWNAKLRVVLGDLHKFIGLWSLWFVLIIGVSGSWWFYQTPLVEYNFAPQFLPDRIIDPALTAEDLNKLGKTIPTPLSSAQIIAAVKEHDPEFHINYLQPPQHNGMAYMLYGTKHDLLVDKYASRYFVHPYTADIIGHRLAGDTPIVQRIDLSMGPLHYGTWGYNGLADFMVKLIWFIFGAAMSVLSISGMIIFYKRTQSATQKLLPESGMKQKAYKAWLIVRPWGGPMSAFKYLNWIFIGVIGYGISISFSVQDEGVSGSGYKYTEQQIGPWRISLNATLGLLEKEFNPIQPGVLTTLNTFISEGNPQAIKFMYVHPRKPRTTRAPGSVVHGTTGSLHAHMPVPSKLKENATLWLTIEDWEGKFYQASWPLMPDGEKTIDMR